MWLFLLTGFKTSSTYKDTYLENNIKNSHKKSTYCHFFYHGYFSKSVKNKYGHSFESAGKTLSSTFLQSSFFIQKSGKLHVYFICSGIIDAEASLSRMLTAPTSDTTADEKSKGEGGIWTIQIRSTTVCYVFCG